MHLQMLATLDLQGHPDAVGIGGKLFLREVIAVFRQVADLPLTFGQAQLSVADVTGLDMDGYRAVAIAEVDQRILVAAQTSAPPIAAVSLTGRIILTIKEWVFMMDIWSV